MATRLPVSSSAADKKSDPNSSCGLSAILPYQNSEADDEEEEDDEAPDSLVR